MESLQTTLKGAVPVSVALIVADPPAHIAPPPPTVAVGIGLTLTVIDPEDVPLQNASLIELMLYGVVLAGLTDGEGVVPTLPVWWNRSANWMWTGGVPGGVAPTVAEPPAHIDVEPLSVAVGV